MQDDQPEKSPSPDVEPEGQTADGADASPDEVDDGSEALVLTSPDASATPREFLLWVGVLCLFVLSLYGPSLYGQFVADDERQVVENETLDSVEGIGDIWTGHIRRLLAGPAAARAIDAPPQFFPLTYTTYWAERHFIPHGRTLATTPPAPSGSSGLNPLVFHITNVLLHALAAAMLWFVLRRLRVPGAWIAAAVFAVHPINVESVAWISQRSNVLSGLLAIGSLLAYLRFAGIGDEKDPGAPVDEARPISPDQWQWYGLSLLLFVAAILSKPMAALLPLIIVLILWWKRRRAGRHLPLLTPYILLGAAVAGLAIWVEAGQVRAIGGPPDVSAAQRIALIGQAIWFYAYKLLVPLKLTFGYSRMTPGPEAWGALTLAIVLAAALWGLSPRIGRGPLVAWLSFIILLVPVSGVIDLASMRHSFVADHFAYHASPALLALMVGAVASLFFAARPAAVWTEAALAPAGSSNAIEPAAATPSPLPYVIAAVALSTLAVLSLRQTRKYDGPITLWQDTLEKNPNSIVARVTLSRELLRRSMLLRAEQRAEEASKDFERASELAEEANRIAPEEPSPLVAMGIVLAAQRNRDDEAAVYFQRALDRTPPDRVDPELLLALGDSLSKLGRYEEANARFRQAVELAPDRASPHYYLATALRRQKREAEAQSELEEAIRLRPDFARAYMELASIHALAGRRDEAIRYYLKVVELRPTDSNAFTALGVLLAETGDIYAAVQAFDKALEHDPANVEARQNANLLLNRVMAATRAATTRSAATQPATTGPAAQSMAPSTMPQ